MVVSVDLPAFECADGSSPQQSEAKLLLRMAVETGFHRPMDRTGWELVDRLVLTFPRMAS